MGVQRPANVVAVLGFEPRKSSALAPGAAQTFCSSHPSASRAHSRNKKAPEHCCCEALSSGTAPGANRVVLCQC